MCTVLTPATIEMVRVRASDHYNLWGLASCLEASDHYNLWGLASLIPRGT